MYLFVLHNNKSVLLAATGRQIANERFRRAANENLYIKKGVACLMLPVFVLNRVLSGTTQHNAHFVWISEQLHHMVCCNFKVHGARICQLF
jgi:hypothetical protein